MPPHPVFRYAQHRPLPRRGEGEKVHVVATTSRRHDGQYTEDNFPSPLVGEGDESLKRPEAGEG